MMEQNRLKSKVVWASVIGEVLSILLLTGVIDTGLGQNIEQIVAGVLNILVTFGVLNNPTVSDKF